MAIEAQQTAVRALYHFARGEAYAVGEYQLGSLGEPKLILLPSPMTLSEQAWQILLDRVRAGAVLLVTGPFDKDPHFHCAGRQSAAGIPYQDVPLTLRNYLFHWPGGGEALTFAGNKTTLLTRAQWRTAKIGLRRRWAKEYPVCLSSHRTQRESAGRRQHLPLRNGGGTGRTVYTTASQDPGILICPSVWPHSTLYVITSESNQTAVSFHDVRSGKDFSGHLQSGRAALLLISEEGKILTSYNWPDQL